MKQLRPLSTVALCLAAWLAAAPSSAHPVTVDGSAADWLTREATGDNLAVIARNTSRQGEYVWRDASGDTRTDLATPEGAADLTRVRVTGDATGLSFLVVLASPTAATDTDPVQLQVAIDMNQVSGSGQSELAGFADTAVAPAAAWEYLLQTQLRSGSQLLVRDQTFATVGAPIAVGVASATNTTLEFTVPWSRLGLSGPPATPLRFTVATFRERSDGNTVAIGDASVSNALDVVSDYNAPRATTPYPNTFTEFTTAGDRAVDYSFDVYFGADGEPYAPLQVTRYVSNAASDATNGGDWIAVRNATPGPLSLAGFRVTDEETVGAGEGAVSLPSAATLAPGGVFVLSTSGVNYAARYGEPADAEWANTDATPDLAAYPTWATGSLNIANGGDEILVLDRSHTAVDIVVYGSGGYAGVTSMSAPASNNAASRDQATFADTDNCAMDFTTSNALCADDSTCGVCGVCALNVCAPRAAGFTCRISVGVCDVAEVCDGAATTCPADGFVVSTSVCRASAGNCDVAETCTGTSGTCPADGFAASTVVCRASAGNCDAAEMCTGTTVSCPADAFVNAGTVCRASAGNCDLPESCSGSSASCPADAFQPSTVLCRAGAGNCDPAETCTGTTVNCPSDARSPTGTVCRASAGPCDPEETCNGSVGCPANDLAPATTVCRPSAGACDVAESCSGSSAACPADTFATSSTVCRPSAGNCDVAESCTGSSAACPTDAFASASTVCRPSAGDCDVAESCTGTAAACPTDAFAPSSTVCRASTGDCDVAESCTGSSAACPANALAPTTTVCRASAGPCDAQETCTGASDTCPSDAFAPSTTVCRPSAGACDVAESCTGSSAACPTDMLMASGTVCRSSAGACDVAETCDGASTACPANGFVSSGTACGDGVRCNGDETCDGAGGCMPGTPVTCAPTGNPCTSSACSETTGACAVTNAMSGTACGDGDDCNGDETCDGMGTCMAGTPPDDGGPMCADASADVEDAADVSDADDAATDDAATDDVEDAATDDVANDVADASAMDDVADASADDVTDAGSTDAATADVSTADVRDASPADAGVTDVPADADGGADMPSMTDGGCGCRASGSSTSGRGALGVLLALGAVMATRRRRRR
ncbi:MAG: lamin tail domain-containing protein [Polyangiales bacterium]